MYSDALLPNIVDALRVEAIQLELLSHFELSTLVDCVQNYILETLAGSLRASALRPRMKSIFRWVQPMVLENRNDLLFFIFHLTLAVACTVEQWLVSISPSEDRKNKFPTQVETGSSCSREVSSLVLRGFRWWGDSWFPSRAWCFRLDDSYSERFLFFKIRCTWRYPTN